MDHISLSVKVSKIQKNFKPIVRPLISIFSLFFGIACILHLIAFIDVNERLAMWAARQEAPDMDPRIMYAFATILLFVFTIVSVFVELFRTWGFQRRVLKYWQLFLIGAAYPVYFCQFALRHVVNIDTAENIAIGLAIVVNPITLYLVFNGFSTGIRENDE